MPMQEPAAGAADAGTHRVLPAKRYLIGRYHEIILKGGNRWRFVEQLRRNVRALFADCGVGKIRGEGPRLIIEIPQGVADGLVLDARRGCSVFRISRSASRCHVRSMR